MIETILLACFWVLQIDANAFSKLSGNAPDRWWLGFVAGKTLGMSSIYFLIRLYRFRMPPGCSAR
jgi:hypothetical protein